MGRDVRILLLRSFSVEHATAEVSSERDRGMWWGNVLVLALFGDGRNEVEGGGYVCGCALVNEIERRRK